jgi:uncharacterized membrane protein
MLTARFRYNGGMSELDTRELTQPKHPHLPRIFAVLIAIVVFATWLLSTPHGLLGKADAVGYALCHRIDLRSFQLGARGGPLCARCSGMYLGVLIGLGFYIIHRTKAGRYPSRGISAVLFLFGVLWAIDGLNSYVHLIPMASGVYTPSNTLRLITGTLIGISLSTMVYPAFSQFAWKDVRDEPVIHSLAELGKLLLFAAILVGLVLSENPLILYPFALATTLSVFIILTLVYTSVILVISRKENQAAGWRDLITPILLGLTMAVIQIGIIDWIRFTLTGTWDGFHV